MYVPDPAPAVTPPESKLQPLPAPPPHYPDPVGQTAPLPMPVAYSADGAAASPKIGRVWLRLPTQKPWLTQTLLGLLVGIFVVMTVAGGSLNATENATFLVKWGAKVGGKIVYDGEWWRLITATFLHGGYLHILFNGYALYMIGSDLEGFFGRARFAAIYAISGLAGSAASLAFAPFNVPGVGASGAIFGLIGALAVYFGRNRSFFGKRGQMQFWNIIAVIVLNVGLGFSGILPVDNSAHLGGLVAGAVVGFVLCPSYQLGGLLQANVRDVENTNRGRLTWFTTLLVGLDVIMLTVVIIQLIHASILMPATIYPRF